MIKKEVNNKMTTAKIWTKESVLTLIEKSDEAVKKGLIAIYNKQTEDEQYTGETRHRNGVGFSGADARLGTSLAQFTAKNNYLSVKQLQFGRKILKKYVGQLVKIANKAT